MNRKIDWTNHLIELVVVFIGITAAFLLNSWREERAERQLATRYYNSLLKDLTLDSDNFEELLSFTRYQDSILSGFVVQSESGTLSRDSLPAVVYILVSFSRFSPETSTFESIKYSGNLDVFDDYDLREDINRYYNLVEDVLLKQELQYNYMNEYCIPYVYENFDILKGKAKPGMKINSEFTNVVVGYNTLLKQCFLGYEDMMKMNRELKLKVARKITN